MNNDKITKILKNDFMVLAIIELIIFFISIIGKKYFAIATSIVYFLVLIKGYQDAVDMKKSAGTIGIVVSVLMLLFSIPLLDIIDFMLGLFMLIHSIKYKKFFKSTDLNNSDSNKEPL